jgi:ribonuclease D
MSPGSDIKGTRNHALITTPDRLERLAASLAEARRVALDLETTGLDPSRDKVRLLTLATEQSSWIIDCFEVDPRPLFPVLAEKQLLIHNALFDLGMLSEMGFELGEGGKVIDTMLMSQLLAGQHLKGKEGV